MGLFDYLRVEYPLDAPEGLEWQTKSFEEPYMNEYIITGDGRLVLKAYDIVRHPVPQAEPGSLDDILGNPEVVNERLVELADFRGEVRFYTDRWEYSALFKDGRLIDMKRLAPEDASACPAAPAQRSER